MKRDLIILLALAMALSTGAARAHEFTAAIFVLGERREERLADAVRGALLAADERDGHAYETSDGHLGGVDLQILPLPTEAAGGVKGLSGSPKMPPDVVVLIGPVGKVQATQAMIDAESIVVAPGALPEGWADAATPGSFAVRYRKAFGTEPTLSAAQGYNAGRRLDQAIRSHDGLSPRAEIEATLAASEAGINW